MQKIHAWIYNPDNAIFKGSSKKATVFELYCEKPEGCDLYTKCNSCLLQDGLVGCKYGKKRISEGPTKRSRNYYRWIEKAKSENAKHIGKLSTGGTHRRIFKTNGHWYLPYPQMHGIFGSGYPLDSAWVSEGDMTTELLLKICTARPSSLMGGLITSYQKEIVPKFIHDLKTHYPDLFQLLPDEHQSRVDKISFVGRRADIRTCAPGTYKLETKQWQWDGEKLIGDSMLFQPVAGSIRIEIIPEEGQPVVITDDDQVTDKTVFLD